MLIANPLAPEPSADPRRDGDHYSDGQKGGSDTASVPTVEPPVADDSVTFTMAEDGTLTISEADLLVHRK